MACCTSGRNLVSISEHVKFVFTLPRSVVLYVLVEVANVTFIDGQNAVSSHGMLLHVGVLVTNILRRDQASRKRE